MKTLWTLITAWRWQALGILAAAGLATGVGLSLAPDGAGEAPSAADAPTTSTRHASAEASAAQAPETWASASQPDLWQQLTRPAEAEPVASASAEEAAPEAIGPEIQVELLGPQGADSAPAGDAAWLVDNGQVDITARRDWNAAGGGSGDAPQFALAGPAATQSLGSYAGMLSSGQTRLSSDDASAGGDAQTPAQVVLASPEDDAATNPAPNNPGQKPDKTAQQPAAGGGSAGGSAGDLPEPAAAPLPAAAWPGLALLSGLVLRRRRPA
ncbi:MAG: hypothetical protein ACLFVN_05355 [Phycisphaeraceae bacterium]